jgi:hypothetical protein
MTKLVSGIKKRVRTVRARGGNIKFRALRLDFGSFSWGSEGMSANPPINSGVCLTNAIIIITPPNQTIVRSFVRSFDQPVSCGLGFGCRAVEHAHINLHRLRISARDASL